MITAKVINEGNVVYVHFSNGVSYCVRAEDAKRKVVDRDSVHDLIFEVWRRHTPDDGKSIPIDALLSYFLELPVEVDVTKPENMVWIKRFKDAYECPVCHKCVVAQQESSDEPPYKKCPICGAEIGVDNG